MKKPKLTPLQRKIAALQKEGLTFEAIGEKWGVDHTQVWRWFKGETKPSSRQLPGLIEKTGLELAELV